MSRVKKQYVVVFFRASWWIDEAKIFGPFTSKAKAAKAMTALYRSDWYRSMGYTRATRLLQVATLTPMSLEDLTEPTTNERRESP